MDKTRFITIDEARAQLGPIQDNSGRFSEIGNRFGVWKPVRVANQAVMGYQFHPYEGVRQGRTY